MCLLHLLQVCAIVCMSVCTRIHLCIQNFFFSVFFCLCIRSCLCCLCCSCCCCCWFLMIFFLYVVFLLLYEFFLLLCFFFIKSDCLAWSCLDVCLYVCVSSVCVSSACAFYLCLWPTKLCVYGFFFTHSLQPTDTRILHGIRVGPSKAL